VKSIFTVPEGFKAYLCRRCLCLLYGLLVRVQHLASGRRGDADAVGVLLERAGSGPGFYRIRFPLRSALLAW